MAVRRNSREPETVRTEGDAIVVTVDARQAGAMAAAIAGSDAARHDEFLSTVARALAGAAHPPKTGPALSRGAFIRGRWSAGQSSTASGPLSGLVVSNEVVPVGPTEVAPPAVTSPAVHVLQSEPRRLQDLNPQQLAEHHRQAAAAGADAEAAGLTALQATQSAAVLQLRADAAAARATEVHELRPDEVEALELAEENALSAAAVARAVAAAATQAAATAAAAAEVFERELAAADKVTGKTPPPPKPPSAPPPARAEENAPESAQIS